MRARRMTLIVLAFYLVFLGGSAYYTLIFPVRLFHHFLMTVLIVLWLFGRLRSGRGLPQTPLNPPIFAAVLVSILSAATSLDPRMSFEYLWFGFIHVMIYFVLVDLFQRGRHRVVMETQFILAALVVFITGLELASWYFGLGFTPGTEVGWIDVIGPGAWLPLELPRVALAMNISTLLAGYVAPLIILMAGWALTARQRDYRQVLWFFVGALTVVLLLTFSRGGLMSLAAAVSTFVALRTVQRGNVKRLLSPRVMAASSLVLVVIGVTGIAFITLSGGRSSGDQVRIDLYRSALEMTADDPLLGVGPGLYGRGLRIYREPDLARDRLGSAHNVYLNTAAETGLLGAAVGGWLVVALGFGWWRVWRRTAAPGQRIRLEAALAALIGVGVHSVVDAFNTTPVVLVILLLAAFCVTGTRSSLDKPPKGRRWPAAAGLVIALAYGVWFVQIDRAHIQYQLSLTGRDDALALAESAARIDPHLNLYDLHIAYLLGERLDHESNEAMLIEAIDAYERAVDLEPTWDTGWMNLAALEIRRGNEQLALDHVERAYAISPFSTASFNIARLHESLAVANTTTTRDLYTEGIRRMVAARQYLPTSAVWWATDVRRAALDLYLVAEPLDLQYRVLLVHDPERAYALVPNTPETAAEWWVAGEYALTVTGDTTLAAAHFSEAIQLNPRQGDYYAARARATVINDPDAALRDLDFAALLGTQFERPELVRAQLTDDPQLVRQLEAQSLPPRIVPQGFAGVLYGGRAAALDLMPEMRFPGPGREAMQPWYQIAMEETNAGDIAGARQVYRAILDYAPDEREAAVQLASLPAD